MRIFKFAVLIGLLAGCTGTNPKKNQEALTSAPAAQVHGRPEAALTGLEPAFTLSGSAQKIVLGKDSPMISLPDQKRAAISVVRVPPAKGFLFLQSESEFFDRLNQVVIIPRVFVISGGKFTEVKAQKRVHDSTFNSCISSQFQFDFRKIKAEQNKVMILAYVKNDDPMLGPVSRQNPMLDGSKIRVACTLNESVRIQANYFGQISAKYQATPVL